MPIEQEPYSENIVVLHCRCDYTFSDVIDNIDSAPDSVASDRVSLIFDVRESTSPRTMDEFRKMVNKLRSDDRFANRHASVIDMQNTLYFGLTRQIQTLASNQGIDYGLFGSIEEAVQFVSAGRLPRDR
jgi:hypothetical protein